MDARVKVETRLILASAGTRQVKAQWQTSRVFASSLRAGASGEIELHFTFTAVAVSRERARLLHHPALSVSANPFSFLLSSQSSAVRRNNSIAVPIVVP